MTQESLSDFSTFVNQQIQIHEKLKIHLSKLSALIAVGLTQCTFFELCESDTRHYILVMDEVLIQAIIVNGDALDALVEKSLQ